MEKNTILIDVDKYMKLHDFKKNVEENKTIEVNDNSWYINSCTYKVITPDKAVKKIAEANEKLVNDSKVQKKKFEKIEDKVDKLLDFLDSKFLFWYIITGQVKKLRKEIDELSI